MLLPLICIGMDPMVKVQCPQGYRLVGIQLNQTYQQCGGIGATGKGHGKMLACCCFRQFPQGIPQRVYIKDVVNQAGFSSNRPRAIKRW